MERLSLLGSHLNSPREVCIVAAGRSPIQSQKGPYSAFSASDLAAQTLQKTLKKHSISPKEIEELYLGIVCPGGIGMSPCRQVALKAGLP